MDSAGAKRAKRNALICATWLCGTFVCALSPAVFAQGENMGPIRVESERVLVPVFVVDKNRRLPDASDLTLKDFHLLEDGLEQSIQSLAVEHTRIWEVHDNLGRHVEYSNTLGGKWSTADLSFTNFVGVFSSSFYVVSYQPPGSPVGSCHHIEVRLDRDNTLVYARSEYCNVENSASDPLDGTQFGKQLERGLSSGRGGEIHVAIQAHAFYGDPARVYVTLDFPWETLERKWINGSLSATIGVLGMVFRKDGTLAARFSDQACCTSDVPSFVLNETKLEAHPEFDVMLIPNRYETQLGLPPGEYVLRVVLSDGRRFGRAEMPLSVESNDGKHLAVSAVAFSRQFHEVSAAPETAALFPAKYVPLVSKGLEVTPTGKTRFRSDEPLVAYFEIYEPQLAVRPPVPVEVHLRIVNSRNGKILTDLDPVKAEPDTESGGTAIPIVQFMPYGKLPKGGYRLEVQATDARGQRTAWRATDFTIE
jgi:hypothetical protein